MPGPSGGSWQKQSQPVDKSMVSEPVNQTTLTFKLREQLIHQYLYRGPLGEISRAGRSYFSWKNDHLIGIFKTFEKAMEALVLEGRVNGNK